MGAQSSEKDPQKLKISVDFLGKFSFKIYVLNDADEGDDVAGLRVVLVVAQDEGCGYQNKQIEVVRFDSSFRWNLK